MTYEKFEEQMFFVTTKIVIKHKSSCATSIGTGFIIRAILPSHPDRSIILLFSNKHLLDRSDAEVEFLLHERENSSLSLPSLTSVRNFRTTMHDLLYYEHDTEDVACINISRIDTFNPFYKSIPLDMISSCNEPELLAGSEVLFVGYPNNRYDSVHNLPIIRKGIIASAPHIDFNGRMQFIIDAQVFQGSSGSPVFTVLHGKYKLIGIVAATMVRNQQLQIVPTAFSAEVQEVIGLGIVIKSTAIKELIDQAITKNEEYLDKAIV
jgi:hypothetical protein